MVAYRTDPNKVLRGEVAFVKLHSKHDIRYNTGHAAKLEMPLISIILMTVMMVHCAAEGFLPGCAR